MPHHIPILPPGRLTSHPVHTPHSQMWKDTGQSNSHSTQRSMDRRAPDLDRHDGVQHPYRGLERLEVAVLVGEDAEETVVNPEANTGVDVFLRRLEPSITLRLEEAQVSAL